MAFNHKHTRSVATDSGSVSGYSNAVGNSQIEISQTFPAGTVNQLISIAFTVANLQSVFLLSDKGCTIKTNSSSSPANTIVLPAGIAYDWSADEGFYACLFTVNVTQAYVSCTLGSRLQVKILTS